MSGRHSSKFRYGDLIVLSKGGNVPFMLRRQLGKTYQKWELVGGCYIHGIMNGEAFSSQDCHDIWIQ